MTKPKACRSKVRKNGVIQIFKIAEMKIGPLKHADADYRPVVSMLTDYETRRE